MQKSRHGIYGVYLERNLLVDVDGKTPLLIEAPNLEMAYTKLDAVFRRSKTDQTENLSVAMIAEEDLPEDHLLLRWR